MTINATRFFEGKILERPNFAQHHEPNSAQQQEPNSAQEQEPNSAQEQEPNSAQQQEPNSAQQQEPNSAQEQEPNSAQEQEPNSAQQQNVDLLFYAMLSEIISPNASPVIRGAENNNQIPDQPINATSFRDEKILVTSNLI